MQPLFRRIFSALLVVMCIIYATCTDYSPPEKSAEQLSRFGMLQDVQVMIFIGFGFLMCFLHRNSLTATSHSMLVAAFTLMMNMPVRGLFRRIFIHDAEWDTIKLGVMDLITAEFCAGAVLISYGALIGRITAAQLLVMATAEVVLYSFNEALLVHKLGMSDVGGSVVIHAFGAFFGLAVSYTLNRAPGQKGKSCDDNMSNDMSDTLSMVGTLFLWVYWPSFNAATSDYNSTGDRVVFNTLFSIMTSCVVAFLVSSMVYGDKFRMVEVQNSTLAGGVAIGTCSDFNLGIFGAMLIGAIAGTVSVLGYRYLQAELDGEYGLKDTCGVCHLHGLPGLVGGFASCIGAAIAEKDKYGDTLTVVFPARGNMTGWSNRSASNQALIQFAGVMITLAIAIVSGLLVGYVLGFMEQLETFYVDHLEYDRPASDDISLSDGGMGSIMADSPGQLQKQTSLTGSLTGSLDRKDPLNIIAPRKRLGSTAAALRKEAAEAAAGLEQRLNQKPQNDEEEGVTFH